MKRNILILFLIPIFAFVSCKKEDPIIKENQGILLLKQIKYSDELSYEFEYNAANLLAARKSKFFYVRYSYNSSNLLLNMDTYEDQRIFSSLWETVQEAHNRKEWVNPSNTERSWHTYFEFDDYGYAIKQVKTRVTDEHGFIATYHYSENNRIGEIKYYYQDKLSNIHAYEYDNNGNLTKHTHYYVDDNGEKKLATTREFEFDNYHNPYYAFRKLINPGLNTNPNNVIKEKYTIHFEVDEMVEEIQEFEYFYEYNEQGYPILKDGYIEYIYK